MDWNSFFKVLMGIEEEVVPIFVHRPSSGNIAAAIITAESAVPMLIAAATNNATPVTVSTQAAANSANATIPIP